MHISDSVTPKRYCRDKSLEHSNKIAATTMIIETAGCSFAFVFGYSSIWLIDY